MDNFSSGSSSGPWESKNRCFVVSSLWRLLTHASVYANIDMLYACTGLHSKGVFQLFVLDQ